MAEHKVQLPDNSVITIEGPEDATDQELIDAASQHYANKQAQNSGPISAIAQTVDNAKNMGGLAYGAGAAGLAGLGALGLGKSLKDKFFSAEKPIERVEPQMDVNQQKPSEPFLEPETQTVRPTDWESSLSAEDRQLLERSRANAAVKASLPAPTAIPAEGNVVPQAQIPAAAQPAPVVPPAPVVEAPVNPKLPALLQPPANAVVPSAVSEPVPTPVLPTTPLKTEAAPVQAEPAPVAKAQAAPADLAPAETPAAKATNDKVLEAIKSTAQTSLGKPDLVTGTGMPAYQGQGDEGSKLAHKKGVFESVKQIPKEYVFVPTGQNMDIVRNAVGQPEYTKNLKSSGGYPASPQAAYEQSRNINKSLGRASMAEAKASGVALPEPTPSITQKIAGSKTVRVAGVTGALILASDLASAAQEGVTAVKEGDRQMATGYLTDIIGALTGPAGFTASQLFGTSPDELRTLRTAEQARKAGAGRGFAPPSAYQR